MVVVFPVPLTPTTMTAWGGGVPGGRSGSPPCPESPDATPSERIRSTSSRSAAFTRETSDSSRRLSRSRTESSRRVAVRTPTSAEKRISSSSASVASSSSLAAPTNALIRAMKPPRVLARPSASVRPASASASFRRASSCAARSAARRASSAARASASAFARAAVSASRRAFSSASAIFRRSYSSLRCASETSRLRRSTSARAAASRDSRASAAASASWADWSCSPARCSRASRSGGSAAGATGGGGWGRSAGFGRGSSDGGLGARRPTPARASNATSSAAAISSATAMAMVWVSSARAKAGTRTSEGPRTFPRGQPCVKRQPRMARRCAFQGPVVRCFLLRQRPRRLAARRIDGRGLRARRRRDGHRVPLPLAPGAHRALAARGIAGDDLVIDRAGRLRRQLRLEAAQPSARVRLHVGDLLLPVAAAPQHLRLAWDARLVAGPGDLRADRERAARLHASRRIHREAERLLDRGLLRRLEADGEPGVRVPVAAVALLPILVLGGEQVLDRPVRLVGRDLRLVALALDPVEREPRARPGLALLAQEHAAEGDGRLAADARMQRDLLAFGKRGARLAVLDDRRPGLARHLHGSLLAPLGRLGRFALGLGVLRAGGADRHRLGRRAVRRRPVAQEVARLDPVLGVRAGFERHLERVVVVALGHRRVEPASPAGGGWAGA